MKPSARVRMTIFVTDSKQELAAQSRGSKIFGTPSRPRKIGISRLVPEENVHLSQMAAFHQTVARHITGITEKCGAGGDWEYPAVDEAMDSAGLHPIGVYIKRRKTTIYESVACRHVYAMSTEA